MNYPQELLEGYSGWDNDYPIRVHRNGSPVTHKEDCILGLHWHEHFEIIDMHVGSAVFYIESKPYEAVAGDLLFVPAGGLHTGYSLIEGKLEYVAIVFNEALMRRPHTDQVYERYITPYLDGRAVLPVKLSADDASSEPARRLVREVTEELEGKAPAYQLVAKHKIELLFALLSRRFLPQKLVDKPVQPRIAEPFKPLIKHIETHYSQSLSINQAARMVNLNPYHFCKAFKKLTGRTFVDYVNGHRMNEADRLLRETDLQVTEIAERVGCGNANYFTKLYKKHKGMPPSHVKKQR
ncbi:AraC family transcriptional regulator [Cohnella endophytica]|uniref:AraC family transcriptional regulator n=1 Tax=Cohnella endophytica TaxID=2419778 RepID=A0A494XXX1_9BACL|nr:AraC family transcriptional regulator [Cohnella endophytica]RKP52934.1 AraC family transcriptional regulator [Cohnella endophytica]